MLNSRRRSSASRTPLALQHPARLFDRVAARISLLAGRLPDAAELAPQQLELAPKGLALLTCLGTELTEHLPRRLGKSIEAIVHAGVDPLPPSRAAANVRLPHCWKINSIN
jgi:hypothetical protein